MIHLNIFIITLIIVFVLDLTDFWENVSKGLSWIITKGKVVKSFQLKPFSCSLCLPIYVNLIYVLAAGAFSIPMMGYILLMSYLTPIFADAMRLIRDCILKVIDKIRLYFNLY